MRLLRRLSLLLILRLGFVVAPRHSVGSKPRERTWSASPAEGRHAKR